MRVQPVCDGRQEARRILISVGRGLSLEVEMNIRARLVCAVMVIFVAGCCGASAQAVKGTTPIENTHWKLTWMPGTKIESGTPQQAPFIMLDSASKRMSGSGGCNQLTGGYELESDHLRFPGVARTMMACRGMQAEDGLVDALDKVREWKVSGSTLSLMDADGHVLARFVATQ